MIHRGLIALSLCALTTAAHAQPAPEPARSHRRFAAGAALGVGVDPGAEEVGFAIAFRIGYRPVPRLAVLYAVDLTVVDLDPEASISAHALVAQLELAPRIFVLAGPAIGVVSPPSGSLSGPGAMASLGYRVQPFTQLGIVRVRRGRPARTAPLSCRTHDSGSPTLWQRQGSPTGGVCGSRGP